MMQRFIYFLTILLTVTAVMAEQFNVDEIVGKLLSSGAESKTGRTDETGIYLICLSEIQEVGGRTDEEAKTYALVHGKKKVAAFLGSNISASESSSSSEITTTENGKEKNVTAESFSSSIKVNVQQFLKGMRKIQETQKGNVRYLVLFSSEKTTNESDALAGIMTNDSPNTVRVIGFSAITDGRVDRAKTIALNNAKASAIEQVLGSVVASTEQAMDEKAFVKVFANSAGCIKQYRVVSEGLFGTSAYRVEVVAEVAKDELMKSYSSLLASMGGVKFFVETDNPFIHALLTEKFTDWGCDVTLDDKTAQYIITCHGRFDTTVIHPADGSQGTRITFSLRIIDANSGNELLTADNDPRQATSFIGNVDRQRNLAAHMAMKEIHGKIHKKLESMIGKMTATGRDVQIVLQNYSGAFNDTLETIKKCAERIPGANQITINISAIDRQAILTLKYQADMDSLRTFMKAAMQKDLPGARVPDEVSTDANTWILTW